MTPAELAAKVKAKYPEYASVPDEELVAKVVEKFPEYKAHLDAPSTPVERQAPLSVKGAQATNLTGRDVPSREDYATNAALLGVAGTAMIGGGLAGLAGRAGAIGKVVSAATSPTGIGVGTTAAELYRGKDLETAVEHGAMAGLGAKYLGGGGKVADIAAGRSLSLKARLAHALGQAVKAEPAVAQKIAPLVEEAAPALKAVAKRITVKEATKKLTQAGARAGANALEKRILDEYAQGQSDGQITDTLRQTHGIPDSFGAQMVKAVRETYGLVTHAMGAK